MSTESIDDDLLWSASAIAKAINRPVRIVFYLLESGQLSARKVGARWVASRRKLLAFLSGDDATEVGSGL